MSAESPLVSVVVPVRNRAGLLKIALQSLREQTLHDWEALVVDDRSSEEERQCIAQAAGNDERIRLLPNTRRRGASAARNAGLQLARGEYVVFLDSDDLLAPFCLARRAELMRSNANVDFAAFLTSIFYERPGDCCFLWNKFNDEPDLDRFLRQDMPWHTTGAIWRAATLRRLNLSWDERAKSWQDWEFHIRALAAGLRYIKVSEIDSYYRIDHPGAISTSPQRNSTVVNRIGVIMRTSESLRQHNKLNRHRRRFVARLLFQHVFHGFSWRRAMRLWKRAKVAGIINFVEFAFGAASETLIRATARVQNTFFDRAISSAKTHMRASFPARDDI